MAQEITDWNDAAADVYSYFNERKRTFDAKHMLAVVDDLAVREIATHASLLEIHGASDFLATVLGHVTTAIHGKGSVPSRNGWYSALGSPRLYHVNPQFAAAWRTKRRLQQEKPDEHKS